MGANIALRIKDIHDGASKTILLAEIRAGLIAPGHARHLGHERRLPERALG